MFIKAESGSETFMLEIPDKESIVIKRYFGVTLQSVVGTRSFYIPIGGGDKVDFHNDEVDLIAVYGSGQIIIFIYPFRFYVMNNEGKTIDSYNFNWEKK